MRSNNKLSLLTSLTIKSFFSQGNENSAAVTFHFRMKQYKGKKDCMQSHHDLRIGVKRAYMAGNGT